MLSLCLWQSQARAQEKGAAERIAAKFGLGVSAAQEAKAAKLEAWQSFSASRTSESSSVRRIEDAAIDIITSVLNLSDIDSFGEQPAAGLKLSHTTAAMKFKLPVMQRSRLNFIANVGVGATQLRSIELGEVPSDRRHRFSEQFLSLEGGVTVKYAISDNCSVFVGARHQYYFESADGLVTDQVPDPGKLLDASSWTFPLTIGFQLGFN
jgi:hypothetical protein